MSGTAIEGTSLIKHQITHKASFYMIYTLDTCEIQKKWINEYCTAEVHKCK